MRSAIGISEAAFAFNLWVLEMKASKTLVDVTKDDLCWVGKFGGVQRSWVRNKPCPKEVDVQSDIALGIHSWPLNQTWAWALPEATRIFLTCAGIWWECLEIGWGIFIGTGSNCSTVTLSVHTSRCCLLRQPGSAIPSAWESSFPLGEDHFPQLHFRVHLHVLTISLIITNSG